MIYPNKDHIEYLRRKYPPGTRLQLSCMEDEMAVPPGSMGTVDFIDDAGQIHMNWDCGRSLALNASLAEAWADDDSVLSLQLFCHVLFCEIF